MTNTGNPNKPGVIDPPHEDIVKMSFDSILKKYPSNGMELIRQHFLIEINKYRALDHKAPLSLDTLLSSAAKKFAEFSGRHKQL